METIKELFKNPKTRSITALVLYFLIGFIIIGVFKNTPKTEYIKPIDKYNNMNNYEYKITYNEDVLEGKILNDKMLIKYKNNTYDNLNIDINPLLLINNKEMYDLIKESTLKAKGNDLIDNLNFNVYQTKVEDNDILINVYDDNVNIVKIVLTLDKQDVIYEYFNFNNVEEWG